MKKIAVISSTDYNSYPVGGMMSFIKDAAPALADRFEVDFWGVDAGQSPGEFTSGGRRFQVRFFGRVETGPKLVPNMLRVVWDLYRNRRALLDEGYDALYIHGIPLNAALPDQIKPKRINHVHGLTNPFLVQGLGSLRAKVLAPLYAAYRRRVVRQSDLVLLAGDHLGIASFRVDNPRASRIQKMENFCDTSLFGKNTPQVDRGKASLEPKSRIIVHVGRFAPQKDPLLALRIMHAFVHKAGQGSGAVLVMIGDGPLLSAGRALAEELGIAGHVRFLGHLERAEIARWLASSDVFLYTSHANGYPISLAEAAQSGLPIVSTSVTGVHDLVRPGENGCLIASRDPEKFVPAITEALDRQEEFSRRSLELAAQYAPGILLDRLCREIIDVL